VVLEVPPAPSPIRTAAIQLKEKEAKHASNRISLDANLRNANATQAPGRRSSSQPRRARRHLCCTSHRHCQDWGADGHSAVRQQGYLVSHRAIHADRGEERVLQRKNVTPQIARLLLSL
jgi:hypothetical protein